MDPLSLIIGSAYGRVLHFARRYHEAIDQFRRTLEIDATFQQAHFDLSMSYNEAGRYEDAIAELSPYLEGSDRRSVLLAVFGNAKARSGEVAGARAVLDELRERHVAKRATSGDLAYVLAALGENDEAITRAREAVEARVGAIVFFKVEPMLDPLRGDPRFDEVIRKLGV